MMAVHGMRVLAVMMMVVMFKHVFSSKDITS
jgi:hypothetical protein